MDPLIDSIRAALVDGATADTKQAGANACRAILVALDAAPGQPLTLPDATTHASAATAPPMAPHLATVIAGLRTVPADQLLDLAITKLRALVPDHAHAGTAAPTAAGFRAPLVPLPRTPP